MAELLLATGKPVWSIGLMTGTVLDGHIDVALLKTDGLSIEQFGRYTLAPYLAQTVECLQASVDAALKWQFEGAEPAVFNDAEYRLSMEQSAAVQTFVNDIGFNMDDIAVIGFHGQTVLHQPPSSNSGVTVCGQTRQLGDGQLMANQLSVPVVSDFRSADMRAGGQGAPLSAVYHQALLDQLASRGNSAVLNLGGVANLTWWDGEHQLIAFDTGPANAPINDFVRERGLGKMDRGGALAAKGSVDEDILDMLMKHPYFQQSYPKSLDRFDFSWRMAEGLPDSDGAALLTAFCASAVSRALDLLPRRPAELIVCGGGRHNASVMQALRERTGTKVLSAEMVGWRGDAVEAECFAYLAVRAARGLPISFPQTTGATTPISGGVLHYPE